MVNVLNWKKWTVGELVSQTKTTIQTGPFGTVLSASEFVDYGIPVISVREIREGFIRITAETPCVTDDTYSRLGKYALSANDIVFARKGSVERSALIPAGIERYFLGSDGIRIRFDQSVVNPDLMLYVFQNPAIKRFLIQSSYGTTMAGLNEKILSVLEFYLPETVEEQKHIAQVLADIDEQLVLTERIISKKKAIKQGAMQELLTGKKRLPGFYGEWENIVLGAVSSFYSGGTPSKKREDWWEGNIPWISSSDLTEDAITTVNINRYISQDAVEHSATRICPKDAVLVVSRVGVGKVAVAPCELCTSQDFTTIVPSRHNAHFLAYMLIPIMKELAMQSQGTSIKGVTAEDIQKIIMPTPTIDEQNQIVDILANMDSEIEALEQKLAKYRQVKQGMMQQLLTGKIRLTKDIEDSVQAEQVTSEKAMPLRSVHNHQFDDAVAIAAIVDAFYSDKYPLGRVKVQKLLYLLHRHQGVSVSDFKKKAAGPYADTVRYKGGEPIAKKNKYIVSESGKQGTRYSKGENMGQALDYVERWGMQADLQWLKENFLHTSRNDLELFATVDMAMCDLDEVGISVSVESVKNLIASNKEWKAKLSKTYFSDWDIARAIKKCTELFN